MIEMIAGITQIIDIKIGKDKVHCTMAHVFYSFCVPDHLYVVRAQISRFCRRVRAEGRGLQIERHETQTETLQICPAE
jgi:hypothetical protein